MSRKRVILGAFVAFALIAAGCKVTVTPTAPHSWAFLTEGARGSGYLTNGPGIPPSGRGSALLTVDGAGREDIGTVYFKGQHLSSITKLQYSTYQAFTGGNESATLQFDVDYDYNDSDTSYQGRLVYIPGVSMPVVANSWQTWDTMANTPGGEWYSSASDGSAYRPIVGGVAEANPPCDQVNYCTWAEIQSNYPTARIRPNGLLAVRAGGPSTGGLSVAVDDVFVGLGGVDVESDFEPGNGTIPVNAASASKTNFAFAQEPPSGTGSFVTGPTGSDGTGSARLAVTGAGGEALSTGVFAGTDLDRFSSLSYKTYVQPGFAANAPTLQLDVDYDSTDSSNAFQGRAVFEPSVAGAAAITDSVWQAWNPLTTPSGWWQTGNAIVGDTDMGQACTQAVPCSWTAFTAAYPDAQVRPITGQVLGLAISGRLYLKAGSNWGGFDGNVDSLSVGISGQGAGSAIYDLEP